MANGIQSLLGPDRPLSTRELYEQRQRELGSNYGLEGTYQGSFPRRLSPEVWTELVGDIPQHRSNDVVQGDPRRLLPPLDSVIAFFNNISSGQPMPQILDEKESIERLRGINRTRGAADLEETNFAGSYTRIPGSDDDNKIYIQPHQMYDVGVEWWGPEGLDSGRSIMVHEAMHFLQRMLAANPDLYGVSPRGLTSLFGGDRHGPKSMTANTLEAAWDALSSVESAPGIANTDDVVDYMVENFPKYDSSTRYERNISRKDAEDTARFMAPHHPINKTLRELTLGEKFKEGILSLFGRDK